MTPKAIQVRQMLLRDLRRTVRRLPCTADAFVSLTIGASLVLVGLSIGLGIAEAWGGALTAACSLPRH